MTFQKATAALVLVGLAVCLQATAGRKKEQTSEPDYTKGEKLEGKFNFWNLGSIGVIGNIWGDRAIGTALLMA